MKAMIDILYCTVKEMSTGTKNYKITTSELMISLVYMNPQPSEVIDKEIKMGEKIRRKMKKNCVPLVGFGHMTLRLQVMPLINN